MKRFFRGFTLAEVLISLGIVGVLASLTMPSLMVNVQKQQTGPALAKAINTLETANKLALSQTGTRRLDQIASGSDNIYFGSILSPYASLTRFTGNNNYRDYTGSAAYGVGTTTMFNTKDGITFISAQSSATAADGFTPPAQYAGRYYTVFVDTNGNGKGPNLLGKDLFVLWVDTNGDVIPFGGSAYATYRTGAQSSSWRTLCRSNTKNAPSNGAYCTAAIVENGFKVLY